jgi:hypothetical protein
VHLPVQLPAPCPQAHSKPHDLAFGSYNTVEVHISQANSFAWLCAASYTVDGHSVSKQTSQQPLDRTAIISRPGTSDPIIYSVGHAERSSIVSDYRTMQSLHRTWAESANKFKSLFDSFIISESSRVKFNDKAEMSDLPPVQYTTSEDYLAIDSPTPDAADMQDSVFLTQQM